ncbi:hypothetical protein [Cellulophaga sp. L1A9]|uniref:hypothetical protein n=1 Tax=Cellulophaga sp. L1A9 TaxID=2686362 RepID=UPI00131DEA40|nr:hypothetical protein [Cellulophaga sp. L1A9]
MKNKILFTCILFTYALGYSQRETSWADLAKVTYTDKFFPAYDDYFLYPEFSGSLKDLEGKQITVTGYFLNIDPNGKLFILSKGPMSACFFCGQGGPETAIELQFVVPPKFKTDQVVSITGILKLNKDDVEHFNYILTDCYGLLLK